MEAAATKIYEDIEPSTEIVQEKDCDTILVYVPGFRKEKLRVQLTSNNFVRISGEREVDTKKYNRFQKQFPISPNYDTDRITARFEKGILYVRLPKLITPKDKPDNKLPVTPPPTTEMSADKPQPQKTANEPQSQTNAQQKTAEKTSQGNGSNKQANEPKAKAETSTETPASASLGQKPEEKPEKGATGAGDRVGKGSSENADASGKTRLDNYKGTAVDLAAKLKMSRRAFYVVLVVLSAVGLGLYFSNFIRSFRGTEISG